MLRFQQVDFRVKFQRHFFNWTEPDQLKAFCPIIFSFRLFWEFQICPLALDPTHDVVKGCRPNNDDGIDREPLSPHPATLSAVTLAVRLKCSIFLKATLGFLQGVAILYACLRFWHLTFQNHEVLWFD